MQWFDRKSNNGYGYGQYTALDVLQAKKSCEKRSIMSNYAKKKKVPGWSFSRSSFFLGGGHWIVERCHGILSLVLGCRGRQGYNQHSRTWTNDKYDHPGLHRHVYSGLLSGDDWRPDDWGGDVAKDVGFIQPDRFSPRERDELRREFGDI